MFWFYQQLWPVDQKTLSIKVQHLITISLHVSLKLPEVYFDWFVSVFVMISLTDWHHCF